MRQRGGRGERSTFTEGRERERERERERDRERKTERLELYL